MKTARVKILAVILITELSFLLGFISTDIFNEPKGVINLVNKKKLEKPLLKYSIENLKNTEIPAGTFEISDKISENDSFTSYLFHFRFTPAITNNIIKTSTGIINIPKGSVPIGGFPIVLMIRGYVDQKIYTSGTGTKNAANYYAENGFVTIAPDFLGYGSSDSEADNIFESRFQTYVTVLSLLKSFEYLSNNASSLVINNSINNQNNLTNKLINYSSIKIWGHSNGGQIALTVLEITGKNYPTVLWAPVSKPFPYSVLYYTDESEDRGKFIRSELSKFEALYDVEKYSLTNYLEAINAPLQIHQGTADEAVPEIWSSSLISKLESLNKDVEYIKYRGADHNLRPDWNNAVEKSLAFYIENI